MYLSVSKSKQSSERAHLVFIVYLHLKLVILHGFIKDVPAFMSHGPFLFGTKNVARIEATIPAK
jgi:hypothetical protein